MKNIKLKDIVNESLVEKKKFLAKKSKFLLEKIKISFKKEFGI